MKDPSLFKMVLFCLALKLAAMENHAGKNRKAKTRNCAGRVSDDVSWGWYRKPAAAASSIKTWASVY